VSNARRWSRLVLGTVLLAVVSGAQPEPRGAGGPGRRYDPNSVETVSGDVVSVDHVPSRRGVGTAVHLTLRVTATETLTVRLGPAWYIDAQKMRVKENDHVEIKGSRVVIGGAPVVIAAVVSKNDKTMVLRNDAGVPTWNGQKAHRRP
jgi:hypothetical protein